MLAVVFILVASTNAGMWKTMKAGLGDKFEFDPESMVLEFGIVPKKTLSDLDFNIVTRLYDESDKMIAVASYLYQMKGKKVTKNLLRLGVRNGKSFKYCYDRRILKGQVPGNIFQDFASPSVYVINKSKTPNFAGNKQCKDWRNLMKENKIAAAQFSLADRNKNTLSQLQIKHRYINVDTATTTFEPITYLTTGPTTGPGVENLEATEAPVASTGDICSVYSNGVVDTFNKESHLYDLKCYHVLAASFEAPTWFIYGAYDTLEGKKSCRAMAIYVGQKAFEISRGWLINYNGQKYKYQEGTDEEIPETGCVISLMDLHLAVDCRPGGFPFVVHYDGYMLAHIELFERSASQIGLCFQNSRGRRINWQIQNQGSKDEDCTVSRVISECEEEAEHCAQYSNSCDGSLERACKELSCGKEIPTMEQMCSLSLARKRKCNLLGLNNPGPLSGCEEDVCLRKYFVLGAGCPQDPFFIGCPLEKYLFKGNAP